jgi:hypothetical protein
MGALSLKLILAAMEKKTLDLLEGLGTDQDSSIAVSIP